MPDTETIDAILHKLGNPLLEPRRQFQLTLQVFANRREDIPARLRLCAELIEQCKYAQFSGSDRISAHLFSIHKGGPRDSNGDTLQITQQSWESMLQSDRDTWIKNRYIPHFEALE